MKNGKTLDLGTFETRLERLRGREFWRSLEDLHAKTVDGGEFPEGAEDGSSIDRRDFLRLMGASVALAGLTACQAQPPQKIVPYVKAPEDIVPGIPLFYATTFTLGGAAMGILVESHEGRPTKIEGNTEHPASLGAADAITQGSILSLYDPDRAQTVRKLGQISTWSEFVTAFNLVLKDHKNNGGRGLRLLTGSVISPALGDQIRRSIEKYPGMMWHQWEPTSAAGGRSGRRSALGSVRDAVYHLDKADVIVSLDADLLGFGPGHVRYAHDFASKRRVRTGSGSMNRLYAVEPTPTITGSIADDRLAVPTKSVIEYARALASAVGVTAASPAVGGIDGEWAAAVARDLRRAAGSSVVAAGEHLPAEIHVLVHKINDALGNVGKTVEYVETPDIVPVDHVRSLRQLVQDMKSGAVQTLVILGGNPVYDAPADLEFAAALDKVSTRVHLGPYYDETSAYCHWHVPETHYLESWGDARAFDGTSSVVQPLIEPLYRGRSPHEVMGVLTDGLEADPLQVVRTYWQARYAGAEFDRWWRRVLHDGLVPADAQLKPAAEIPAANVSGGFDSAAVAATPSISGDGMEIVFRADGALFDGRYANNGWLQEMPRQVTKLTWDNAAMISPSTAARLGVKSETMVELRYRGRKLRMAAWILPGQADGVITVHLGYGRTRAGKVGDGAGFDTYRLRTADALSWSEGLELSPVGGEYRLACTQRHQDMYTKDVLERDIIRTATFDAFRRDPMGSLGIEPPTEEDAESIYPGWKYTGYAWAMSIDTTVCIGCQGCVIACQAENNIPIVGKTEVLREREMHWIRIDRYHYGDPSKPRIVHQPMPCQQCENAPCEPVCPVEATTHSPEGLNDMTYNRCVGTRYCANNCPYKVRRFNFFQYADFNTEAYKLGRNPDVTVRERGVMEKCTYCVQRITAAKIKAEIEDRKVRDGEIVPACQQTCPTHAIVFGDINDPESAVSKLKGEAHNYGLLGSLNVRPRTTYLATIRNPNPEISS